MKLYPRTKWKQYIVDFLYLFVLTIWEVWKSTYSCCFWRIRRALTWFIFPNSIVRRLVVIAGFCSTAFKTFSWFFTVQAIICWMFPLKKHVTKQEFLKQLQETVQYSYISFRLKILYSYIDFFDNNAWNHIIWNCINKNF